MATNKYRIFIINHSKQNDHVEYLIRIDIKSGETIESIEFLERYSNLKILHDKLIKETTSPNFPRFPPKKFFGGTDEKFLNQRQTELNIYFITISDEFSNLPSLNKWIKEELSKHNRKSLKEIRELSNNNQSYLTEKKTKDKETYLFSINNEINNQKYKEIIETTKKLFIELEKILEGDLQEDIEKEKEYKNIINKIKIFSKNNSSNLFYIEKGEDSNFNLLNRDKEGILEREKMGKKIIDEYDKKMVPKICSIYYVNGLIVPI